MLISITLILLVLVIVGILWIRRPKPDPMIEHLRQQVSALDLTIPYQIRESRDSTYVEDKYLIHLVLRDGETYFDNSTLLAVTLHEIAHILCPPEREEHSETFYRIERDLISRAEQQGWLPPGWKISGKYPGCY